MYLFRLHAIFFANIVDTLTNYGRMLQKKGLILSPIFTILISFDFQRRRAGLAFNLSAKQL